MTELSPEAKRLLETAREEFSPTDQRVANVRSALELRIHLARGAGGASGGSTGWMGWSASHVVGLALVAIGFTTAVGMFATRRPNAAAPIAPSTTLSARRQAESRPDSTVRSLQPQPTAGSVQAPPIGLQRMAVAGKPRAIAQAPHSSIAANTHEAQALHSSRGPSRSRAERGGSGTDRSVSNLKDPGPASTEVAAARDNPTETPVAGDQVRPVADNSLAREIALLRNARAALDQHDPKRALAMADEHAALFANGTMRQEQLATRVLALCALKRQAEATAAKRELERIAPRSPHLMQIGTSCAAEGRPGGMK
jgi:hypothetical protein